MVDKEYDENNIDVEFLTSPEKTVPKFCSSVLINKLVHEDAGFIFTFIYQDKTIDEHGAIKKGQPTLIERLHFDPQHAQDLLEALQRLLINKEN